MLLSADFKVDDAYPKLSIDITGSETAVYLRTEPGSQSLQYRFGKTGAWSSDFGGDAVTLSEDYTIDVKGKNDDVVYLAGIETNGNDLTVKSSIDVHLVGDLDTVDTAGMDKGFFTLEVKQSGVFAGGTF